MDPQSNSKAIRKMEHKFGLAKERPPADDPAGIGIGYDTDDYIGTVFNEYVLEKRWSFISFKNWAIDSKDVDESTFEGNVLVYSDWATNRQKVLVEYPNAIVLVRVDPDSIGITVNALDKETVESVYEHFKRIFPLAKPQDDNILVHFWTWTSHGSPQEITRRLTAPDWEDIENNYAARTQNGMARLISKEFDSMSGGKLILWHGKPGSGKTYALRSLAKNWRDWADIHYILDPENFFGSVSSYMINVLIGNSEYIDPDEPAKGNKWRVVILEDTGELLTKDAKERSGQGLSRLLNVCDGLIGQGLRILVLITTNEELGTLHAAVTRPGRCAANIEFEDLDTEESKLWLKERGVDVDISGSHSLAELFSIIGETETIVSKGKSRVGFTR